MSTAEDFGRIGELQLRLLAMGLYVSIYPLSAGNPNRFRIWCGLGWQGAISHQTGHFNFDALTVTKAMERCFAAAQKGDIPHE